VQSNRGYPAHMSSLVVRGACGCAIALAATVAGPATLGAGVANAGLLGDLGPDINVLGVDISGKAGPSHVGSASRDSRLAAVSTAPSARQVVIRAKPAVAETAPDISTATFDSVNTAPAAAMSGSSGGGFAAAPAVPAPMAAPSVPMPSAPVIEAPKPQALPVTPSTAAPQPGRDFGPADKIAPAGKIPTTFRVGYEEYLRAADTSDLVVAAVPGATGIAGFVLIGAFAGYRQARALQRILLAPVPTGFLL
jgi:hypothetical protein